MIQFPCNGAPCGYQELHTFINPPRKTPCLSTGDRRGVPWMAAGVVRTPLTCIYFECIIMDKQEELPITSVSIRIPVEMLAQ